MKHSTGTFCWADLMTTNQVHASEFYSAVFGWQVKEVPAGENMTYSLLLKNDQMVAGMGQQSPEQQQQGVPPFWASYVAVDNVEQWTQKAQELGATVLVPPMDATDAGRMSFIADPTGATLGLWQAKNHQGVEVKGKVGAMAWNELLSSNAEQSKTFFTSLFGWTAEASEMPTGTYWQWKQGEQSVGGMMQIQKEWGTVPSHWATYFTVENVDKSIETVQAMGGKVTVPVTELPFGRFATIQDPQGAHLSLWEEK